MHDSRPEWILPLGLTAAILAGAILRFVWVADIEYKADEAWTFQRTQNVAGEASAFSWLGMGSSAGPRNPGMSLWVFQVLGKLTDAHDPTTLARAVQVLSIVAILMLVWFACRWVAPGEREPWLWSAAFLSVNPLAVLFHRKIWPPSVAPIFVSFMLIAWWNRQRFWWAAAWGLLGACLGQIHMAGFFFAAGFATWALLFDRKQVAWRGWLAGSCLGALPLLPWLYYLATDLPNRPATPFKWWHALEGRFWLRWLTEPLGLGLQYSLDQDFGSFLSSPVVHGQPTYLVGLVQGISVAAGLSILVRAIGTWWRFRQVGNDSASAAPSSPTGFTLSAAALGFGILMTMSCLPVHRCYMIFVYPFEFLWLARLALGNRCTSAGALRSGRTLLSTLCIAQCLLSASFLAYVHVHQTIHGDYGIPYGAQLGHAPTGQAE